MLGLKEELKSSLDFHSDGVALLVSPLLLKSRDLGQIDLSRLRKDRGNWILEVAEVKSSELGELVMVKGQKGRLIHSQNFLSSLFGISSKLIKMTKKVF